MSGTVLRFCMQIYKNKMREAKMWDEKVVIRRYFFALSGILLFFRIFAP